MRKAPKHKIILIIGLIFFAASPFLFWFAPRWFIPIFCNPSPRSYLPCTNEFLIIGLVALFVSLAIGGTCLLWALRSK